MAAQISGEIHHRTPGKIPSDLVPTTAQEMVRNFCRETLRVESSIDASGPLVTGFDRLDPGTPGIQLQTMDNLRNGVLQYSWSQPSSHPFNRQAIELLTEAMLEKHLIPRAHAENVGNAIASHLAYIGKRVRRVPEAVPSEYVISENIRKSNQL